MTDTSKNVAISPLARHQTNQAHRKSIRLQKTNEENQNENNGTSEDANAQYDLYDDWQKKMCFEMMASLWRSGKSRLVKELNDAKNESERLAMKRDCIKSDAEWRSFVTQKTSKEHMAIRAKFQERRKKVVPHILSRRGYAQTIDDMGGKATPSEGQSLNVTQSNNNPSPKSVGLKKDHNFTEAMNACYMLDWSDTIVAEGRWISSDTNIEIHGLPLGPEFMLLRVDVAIVPGAYLFRPNYVMLTIQEVVGSTVVWPSKKVIPRDAKSEMRMGI
ncbi:hypothetical protein CsatB_029498 [Cannabis sativa]